MAEKDLTWSSEVMGGFSNSWSVCRKAARALQAVDGKMTAFLKERNKKEFASDQSKPCNSSIHKAPDE